MQDDMTKYSAPVRLLVWLARASQAAYTRKGSYAVTTLAVFAITVGMAATLDLLPEAPSRAPLAAVAAAPLVTAPVQRVTAPELPTEIVIPALDRTVTVANPVSTDIAVLDRALLGGAVRYPTSAKLGEDGNVIIFGHSRPSTISRPFRRVRRSSSVAQRLSWYMPSSPSSRRMLQLMRSRSLSAARR
jgi:hypothetical protein